MNIHRLTQKSQEALRRAQEIASERGNTQVEEEHLLTALLEQPEGVVNALLAKIGIAAQDVKAQNEALLGRLATAYGGASQPGISPELRNTVTRSHELMADMRDEYVSVEHLF